MEKQYYYQNVPHMVVKNQDFLKTNTRWNIKQFSP